jgi:hypothetical protein
MSYDTVPAFPMKDNFRAHSGEKYEEIGRRNGVIRVSMRQHSSSGDGVKCGISFFCDESFQIVE